MTLFHDCLLSAASAMPPHSTGKERDAETGGANGNDYFGARYYSSTMGRWLSPDWSAKVEPVPYAKLGDPQSLDLYSYVLGNPLSNIDADGHNCDVKTSDNGRFQITNQTPGVGIGCPFSVSLLDQGLMHSGFFGRGKNNKPVGTISNPIKMYGFATPLTGCSLSDSFCRMQYERFLMHVVRVGAPNNMTLCTLGDCLGVNPQPDDPAATKKWNCEAGVILGTAGAALGAGPPGSDPAGNLADQVKEAAKNPVVQTSIAVTVGRVSARLGAFIGDDFVPYVGWAASAYIAYKSVKDGVEYYDENIGNCQ